MKGRVGKWFFGAAGEKARYWVESGHRPTVTTRSSLCYDMRMEEIEENLANWGGSLVEKIPIGGLLSRNPVVYKWKAPFRSWMIRELTIWREHDLMAQSLTLYQQGHVLGARILLRSGFETLAMLIYLNMLMQQVLEGKLDFHEFGDKTVRLLLGARNNDALPNAINILTILEKCDKQYPGIREIYDELSESAHPNYDGLMDGYSNTDYDEYETTFSNLWMERYGDRHLSSMNLCMATFHHEYNNEWRGLMEKLEQWIEENDKRLEATKGE